MTDVLSDVLAHLQIKNVRCTRLEAAGEWALRFRLRSHMKFVTVLKGDAWLTTPGDAAFHLVEGDMFLLASAASYSISSNPALTPIDGLNAFDWDENTTARVGGNDTILLGGALDVDGSAMAFLFEALPPIIHIPATLGEATPLRLALSLLDAEVSGEYLGGSVTRQKLAEVLLIQALRFYSATQGFESGAWLTALADDRIGRVLQMVHDHPGYAWKVPEFAVVAGMSRSSFAARFTKLVGLPPLAYLQRWRMERARYSLRTGEHSMAEIARQSGYSSVSAFGATFKREFGISPARDRLSPSANIGA